ncbi:MAG TPA: response regulator [Bacteroidales bacterium]|nr:response regulator [Bacteroidales bacterium]
MKTEQPLLCPAGEWILKHILTLLLTAITTLAATGQSLQLVRYSENDGLSNALVKSVATDRNGLIWVGTDGGLFFFDGHEFSPYTGDLPSPYVKSVFCRKNGDMIVTTDLGVLADERHGSHPAPGLLFKGSVQQVDSLLWFPKTCYEDGRGRLWFGDNRKIYCLNGKKLHTYNPGEKAWTNNFQRSFSFAEDGNGHLFSFAEPGCVFRFNAAEDRFEEVRLPFALANIEYALSIDRQVILVATRTGLVEFTAGDNGQCTGLTKIPGSPEVSCLFRYADGSFYAGTWSGGLYDIHRNNGRYSVTHLDEIMEKNINAISEGSEGNIWIASDNGLLLLRRNLFSSLFRQVTGNYIQCISGEEIGKVYFCDGQSVYLSVSGNTPYPPASVSTVKRAGAMILQAVPANGGMWYSDVNARIWFEKPAGSVLRKFDFSSLGHAVFYLLHDQAGDLWAIQDQNTSLIRIDTDFVVHTYGRAEGITSRPLVIAEDDRGRIFVGGMADTAYLFGFDRMKNRFSNLSRPIRFEHNIDININDLACGKNGELWLGSSFGLLRYNHGEITRTDLGAITGSSVKAVAIDANRNIWIGNSSGLHLYAGNELLSFDERSGLSSKIINYRCLHVDLYNRLWVGTVEGVIISTSLEAPRKTVTPVIFTLLLNNEREIPYMVSGTSFNDRSFATLKAGVLDYPYIDFRTEMLLRGRDSVWQPVPRSGSIILANLEPGKYTLLLRSKKTGNYLTSDSLRWDFTVTRIWYTRGWVIFCMGVAVLLLFWLGLRLNTLNLKRYNERLERAIRERTRETLIQKERIEAQHASILLKNEELRQANIRLEAAKELAEEASEAQKKFLSVMTHELRTPLNAVIGASHLLIRNNPRQDQYEELQILRFSAENLLSLINNILDFTKIESGKVILEKIGFNLHNLVEEIVSAMKIRAKEKNIRLGCQIDPEVPTHVIGDPLRLSQIINNLMGNALKFTERGTIDIRLTLARRTGEEVVVDFLICDTGIGMSKETMENIFDLFVQGSSETTRKYGGTGLGLVITRKLLELYDSEIRAESEPGTGTCFSFSIRFPEVTRPEDIESVDKEAYAFTLFRGQSILLVEDNQVNRMIAMKFLKEWNLAVECAENGRVALERIREGAFDLVLMDIQMPEMDGYQASAAIRAMGEEPYTSIPIIALTAAIRSDVSEMIFQSGMNDFISKPFNPVDLHQKIKKHLES